MNISTKLSDEQIDPGKPSGGYEWWYFDALSADKEWGIVIIFYDGNPFSPKYIQSGIEGMPSDYPAISVSLYKRSKTEFYSFLEYKKGKFHWEVEPMTASVGSNFFQKSEESGSLTYEILLNQVLDSGHEISGKISFKSPLISDSIQEFEETRSGDQHLWNLIQPRATVIGSIEVKGKRNDYSIRFSGTGYHDHNKGYEPLKEEFDDWYWGRFHFSDSTLIYYVMNRKGGEQHKAWLLDTQGEVLESYDRFELEHHTKNRFGLNSARKITIKKGGTDITIQQRELVDNGPFYQRFLSDGLIRYREKLYAAQGITEYIQPRNIYNEKYWWMVKMRLRFMAEKPHWVQRFKNLYEWTW